MTLLPQRKKSPEEIAQLRDKLGIPEIPNSTAAPSPQVEAPEPVKQEPKPEPKPAKPVRSLKKSERAEKPAQEPEITNSNRLPQLPKKAIPAQRRSAEELEDLRKRQALSMLDTPVPNPKLAKAHGLLIGLGYICTLGGAGCFFHDDYPLTATAASLAAAFIIAGFISLKRPISRHHAGFIAAISFVISVFSALHFFPQLNHAS